MEVMRASEMALEKSVEFTNQILERVKGIFQILANF